MANFIYQNSRRADSINPIYIFRRFLGLGHLRGPGIGLGRMGGPSIGPFLGDDGGVARRLYRPPPCPSAKAVVDVVPPFLGGIGAS